MVDRRPRTGVDVKEASASRSHGFPSACSNRVSKESGSVHSDGSVSRPLCSSVKTAARTKVRSMLANSCSIWVSWVGLETNRRTASGSGAVKRFWHEVTTGRMRSQFSIQTRAAASSAAGTARTSYSPSPMCAINEGLLSPTHRSHSQSACLAQKSAKCFSLPIVK